MPEWLPEWMHDLPARVLHGVAHPAHSLLSFGTSRYFWVYCATGLLIAAFAYRRHRQAKSFQATLLDHDTWLSKSAINDYLLLVIVPVLKLTILSWALLNAKTVAGFVAAALTSLGVTATTHDGSAVAAGFALTVSLFIVDDFLRWYVHYLFHRIPEFWEFHKVHHSAEVLNFATADRIHPVESIADGVALSLGYGVVNGLFIAFFGDSLTVATVAGANIFVFAFNIAGGVLRHSPFWVSFGPRVERWVISPAMHQIHHSNKPEHFDKNLGGALSVWDRWFGTLHIPRGREVEGFGIGPETPDYRSMRVILLRPFTASAKLFGKRFGISGENAKAGTSSAPAS